MPRKPPPKPDDPEQFKHFIDMAREVEADESPDAIDRAFDKVIAQEVRTTKRKGRPVTRRRSTKDALS